MAVHIQKHYNPTPIVYDAGVRIRLSSGKRTLYLYDATDKEIARFHMRDVREYWVTDSAIQSNHALPSGNLTKARA